MLADLEWALLFIALTGLAWFWFALRNFDNADALRRWAEEMRNDDEQEGKNERR